MSPSKDKYKTLFEIFQLAKQTFGENNLTYREISLNTGLDPVYLRMLFDDKNKLVSDLSKIFEFAKIDLATRKREFNPYRIYDDGENIKITRVLEPRCSMYYVRKTQEYYKFAFVKKRFKESKTVTKELIASEMNIELQNYLDRNKNKLRY